MFDIMSVLMPMIYLVIIVSVIKPMLEVVGLSNKRVTIKPKDEKIKIKELSEVVYKFMKSDCAIHGSGVARKLWLRTGVDTKVFVGTIVGWNKEAEMTYFLLRRGYKKFVILTNKDVDTLHYDVVIVAETIKHITDLILYVTDYDKAVDDFIAVYNYILKYYFIVMNTQSHDGQYLNMISVYRKRLAEQIDYETINRMRNSVEEEQDEKVI